MHELDLDIPYTHEIETLLDLLMPHDESLTKLRRGIARLTQYAVDYRYPGARATARKARSALRQVDKVRDAVRARLGLRPRREAQP